MSKLKLGALAAGLTVMAALSAPAFAIGNAAECVNEGGSTVANKGLDYCLIPIRDEEYRSEAYDGNKLGVSDCPGDVLNDGKWCMIKLGEAAAPAASTAGLGAVVGSVVGGGSSSSSGLGTVVSGVTGGGSSSSSGGGGSSSSSGLGSVVSGVTGGGSSSSSGLGSVVGGVAGGSTSGVQSEIATGLVKDRLTGGNKSTTDIAVDLAKKKGEDVVKDKAGSALGGLTGK